MNVIETHCAALAFNRGRTLGLLEQIEQSGGAEAALAWRPAPGRAPIGWQLMHIGVTEELFATERLRPGKAPQFEPLWERFRGGSTPDDLPPTPAEVRELLAGARESLLETLRSFDISQLDEIVFPQRDWTLQTVLQVLLWHEAHHQGQAHITWNLFNARG